jgi:hypothetical protein
MSERERQALGSIEDGLAGSEPALSSMLGIFSRLTSGPMASPCRRWTRSDALAEGWFQAVAASPRLVSHPNAFGSGRSGRTRIC